MAPPPREMRGFRNLPVVKGRGNILVAFKKQMDGKVCTICGKLCTLAGYRAHYDSCPVPSDSDLEVLDVISPREKRRRGRENPIVVDDEEDEENERGGSVKRERTTPIRPSPSTAGIAKKEKETSTKVPEKPAARPQAIPKKTKKNGKVAKPRTGKRRRRFSDSSDPDDDDEEDVEPPCDVTEGKNTQRRRSSRLHKSSCEDSSAIANVDENEAPDSMFAEASEDDRDPSPVADLREDEEPEDDIVLDTLLPTQEPVAEITIAEENTVETTVEEEKGGNVRTQTKRVTRSQRLQVREEDDIVVEEMETTKEMTSTRRRKRKETENVNKIQDPSSSVAPDHGSEHRDKEKSTVDEGTSGVDQVQQILSEEVQHTPSKKKRTEKISRKRQEEGEKRRDAEKEMQKDDERVEEAVVDGVEETGNDEPEIVEDGESVEKETVVEMGVGEPQMMKAVKHEGLKNRYRMLVSRLSTLIAGEPSESVDVNVSEAVTMDDEDVVWKQGVHYTVSFTLRMIRRVLTTPTSSIESAWKYDELFWGDDILAIEKFVNLGETAKKLFLRLFLRKNQWQTLEVMKNRILTGALLCVSDVVYIHVIDDFQIPRNTVLSNDVADMEKHMEELVKAKLVDKGDQLTSLNEILQLLPAPKIKEVARQFQADYTKGKQDLIMELMEKSRTQRAIFGLSSGVAKRMTQIAKTSLGPVYRAHADFVKVLKAIFTLYSPVSMNSSLAIDNPMINLPQALLFELLQLETRKVLTPAPNPCTEIISVYKCKNDLYSYLAAKDLEMEVLLLTSQGKHKEASERAVDGRNQLLGYTDYEFSRWTSFPPSLRRFSPIWVLVRVIAHGASIYEKMKMYKEAVHVYRFLLKEQLLRDYCPNERGAWWDRLVLGLHYHLKLNSEALEECLLGMDDELIGDKDRLLLQDRVLKLCKEDFVLKVIIGDPIKKIITGTVLKKNIGDARVNRFIIQSPNGDTIEASVEEVVRQHYLQNMGYTTGLHSEGAIWHTVYGLLFYDIINHHARKEAWLCELQQAPVDLSYADFYPSRKAMFDDRLHWLKNASVEEYTARALTTYREHLGETTHDLQWQGDEGDLKSFLSVCNGSLLADVCERMIKDYRNTRSGYPDLTLWNETTGALAVVEVKGPGDRLSTKQRLWLDFFVKRGLVAEVCHVENGRHKHNGN